MVEKPVWQEGYTVNWWRSVPVNARGHCDPNPDRGFTVVAPCA